MTYESSLKCISVPASADLSAKQYYFMNIDSNGQMAVAGAGARAEGVLQDKPSAIGRTGALAINGVSKVFSGGTITAGDAVASDGAGKARKAATGDQILGTALSAAVANDIFPVLIESGATGP